MPFALSWVHGTTNELVQIFKNKLTTIFLVSGWAEFATTELPRIPHKTRKLDDQIVVINVSGVRYMCWKSTLEVID